MSLSREQQDFNTNAQGNEIAEINVAGREREISIVAGVTMALLGLHGHVSLRKLVVATLGGMLIHRGLSGHCPLYSAMGIDTRGSIEDPSAPPDAYSAKSIHVEAAVTVNKSAAELYRFWRDVKNLPRVMDHLKQVTEIDGTHSHWIAQGPLHYRVEWDAQIINDIPDSLIAWESTGDAEVDNAGSVKFLPLLDGTGTEVRVVLDYIPPAGRAGRALARLFREEPSTQIRHDLWRFKQLMEHGQS